MFLASASPLLFQEGILLVFGPPPLHKAAKSLIVMKWFLLLIHVTCPQ